MTKTTTREKLFDYVFGGVAGLAGALVGLSRGVTVLLVMVGWAIAFFAPYQIRRFVRYWKRRRN